MSKSDLESIKEQVEELPEGKQQYLARIVELLQEDVDLKISFKPQ